jgi:hypothetical protein
MNISKELQSYYKLMEEDLEEITKEWSADLLIPANPAEISNIDSPENAHRIHLDLARQRRPKRSKD